MGINNNLLPLLQELDLTGRMLTLGMQKAEFNIGEQLSVVCESLDVSDYEGADHIFDLNDPNPPQYLVNSFDAVFTGGTLEHVFHVSVALQNAASFVKIGGLLIHLGPANGWINHGFYQLCPTWALDYLHANRWQIESSLLIDVISRERNDWRITPTKKKERPRGVRQLHYCVARRMEFSTLQETPKQNRYIERHLGSK